ncbi:MAG TPA: response regulator transcription factor [Marinagarivorans sp.]
MNLLLVEDQAMVRGALEALLNLEDDIQVVACASNGLVAKAYLAEHAGTIDVIVTDIQMPELDGIGLCLLVKQQYPDIPVVMLTTFARAGYLQRALDAGAVGFLLKDAPAERLAMALRDVAAGRKVIDSELALSALGSRQDPLTDKERQALKLAQQGLNTAAIGKKMCLSQGTVRNYLSEAISKLQANNRIDAARIAAEKGWI